MAKTIIIEPQDLWECYQNHKEEITEIANNEQYGVVIYLECYGYQPWIVVESDGLEVYKAPIVDADDAAETCRKIYDEYLSDAVVNIIDELGFGDNELSSQQQEIIEEREIELSGIVSAFLDDILGFDYLSSFPGDEYDNIVEDCKEHFLEYLARKHKFEIYRPMILEDEDGNDFFEEYPYECMEFDDKDNPIYK